MSAKAPTPPPSRESLSAAPIVAELPGLAPPPPPPPPRRLPANLAAAVSDATILAGAALVGYGVFVLFGHGPAFIAGGAMVIGFGSILGLRAR